MLPRVILLALLLAGAGCATPSTANRPFTEDWAYVSQRDDDPPEVGGDIVISGQTVVHIDEEGTPALQIGNNSRWRTEVSVDGGDPEINVKYKVQF